MNAALSYDRFGDPAEVMTVTDQPLPELGPRDVRVRMTLAAIHNHDIWTVRGGYGVRPPLPAVGGSEAVGVVESIGADVKGLVPGQRVVALGVPTWRDAFVIADKALVPVPDTIDDAAACQLIAMPLSALMLLEDTELPAGAYLAQNAANGAVGTVVARLGQARGVNVLSLVRRAAAVDAMRALGIGNVVATDTPGLRERVKAVTGGAPVLRAIESVGGADAGRLLSVLADGGTLVAFGSMSGEPMQIDSGELIFKGKKVEGFWAMHWQPKPGRADRKALIGELIGRVASGELPLTVDAVFPLHEAVAAFAAHARPGRSGKIAFRAR